ncbi:LPS assembly protein LptD [Aestuariivita sp.]|jgi:LPS-assembly protein|uniref:LPS-assembly protein LptD n=1 Tax=Aestuariivita sp. TaxID=1872407 RepID=UPI00216D5311|nr:LPS assembly protein LptD [Aestuariivita sp.]MCE8007808.1 LPS-assembly protein LptD [Aestuariivita sp.]
MPLWLRALCLLVLLPVAASAQDAETGEDTEPAVLIADRVSVTPDGKLIATGSVEAFQGTQKLTARRITYDRETETLSIEGPIRLTDGPSVTILADAAELDRDMQNGLLQGARMVLDQQVQLSALRLDRTEGRYSQLYKTSVTSCRICEEGQAPLWQIRARRVIHDQEGKQLYFEEAQLRVMDVPVLYLPRLRLPDPTLNRATGFLNPSFRTTSQLSTGVRIPYFFRLGDHRDLTVTPYLSSRTTTLGLRYRQAFARGRIEFEGAYSRDDQLPGTSRGYIFGAGGFALRNGYQLTFDIEWASDNAYLVDYGLPDKDRLDSEIALTRVTRDTFSRAALVRFQSLRDGEDESLLPAIVADVAYDRRYFPDRIGGELRLGLRAHAHERSSDLDVLGRDVTRITSDISWQRSWILASGLRADWQMGFAADLFRIAQDSTFPGTRQRVTPYTALTLRLPMIRATARATHFIEPILQVGWTNVSGDALPNDESGRVEFDQGNLLSLSRFPAPDAREDGPALAYGVNWARYGQGWQASLTMGQIIRETPQTGFSTTSGLSGDISDFLLAGQVRADFGLDLTARTIFDDSFDVSKAELRGGWIGERATLGGTFVWLEADAAEDRTQAVSEFYLDGSYDINPTWTASANWRYDLADTRAATAGLGLTYRNECVEVGLSVNRRYTSSTSVEPSTDFGFNIALRGFSATNGTERHVRSCKS